MKRRMTKYICIILLMLFVATMSACGAHEHSYGDWNIEEPATCIQTGRKYRECKCGEKEYDTIPELQHNFVDGVCTVCGAEE